MWWSIAVQSLPYELSSLIFYIKCCGSPEEQITADPAEGLNSTYKIGLHGKTSKPGQIYLRVTVQMPDADSDGMSDLWEQAHFGSSGILSTGDADGDGISNLDEYLQGSNPLDGDVNGDGRLNIVDLLLAQRHVLGVAPLNPSQEAALDLAPLPGGADGVVNPGDIVVLQRRILAAH